MAGIIFAKFTVPRNRGQTIYFSKNAVISLRNGMLQLMCRITDLRKYSLLDARVTVSCFECYDWNFFWYDSTSKMPLNKKWKSRGGRLRILDYKGYKQYFFFFLISHFRFWTDKRPVMYYLKVPQLQKVTVETFVHKLERQYLINLNELLKIEWLH